MIDEKYLTCINCGKPLSENEIVKDAYKQNTVQSWAHGQLKILADMLEDRGEEYISHKIREIIKEFKYLKR